jgi:hypothetical protein
MSKKPYTSPTVTTVGSVADLTEQGFNKVGSASDQFTQLTGGVIVGSIVPAS